MAENGKPEFNSTVIMEGEVVKKKRGRKPGSISKKKMLLCGKLGKKLGKKRGRKPKHIKEKLMRQAALQKLKQQQKMRKKLSIGGSNEEFKDNSEYMHIKRQKVADIESKL